MNYRLFIIKLAGFVLAPILIHLKKEAEKTPSPIDDRLIQVGEILLAMIMTGEINDILNKPQ